MNILLKKLITSKRVQDTAGVIRGTYRILNVYQSNRSSSLIDLENSQTSQTDETYKHSQDINKKENFPIDEENKIKRQSTDDNSENISSGKEEIILKSNSFNMQEKKMKGSSFSNEEKKNSLKEDEEIKKQMFVNSTIESDNIINLQKEGNSEGLNIIFDPQNFNLGSEKAVPAGSWSRAYNFGKLGFSLLGGGISEALKQNLLPGSSSQAKSQGTGVKRYFLNESNAEKISIALCKMRGAPLKLGQVLSIQEDELIPKSIREAFEKARKSANIMPKKQLHWMLEKELGKKWREFFLEFNEIPFAAASIGQVHLAKTKEGNEVAVKVQYPGVMESIESDLNNLKTIMIYTNIFPKTMFLDQLIQNTKIELIEECNYLLEAKKQETYKNFVADLKGVHVPGIIKELSTNRILTSEYVKGTSLDFVALNYSQEKRNSIGERIMLLTLEELFKYKFMQTDPNPANFFYDIGTDLLYLLDFGAARSYPDHFINNYIKIVYGAVVTDREMIMEASREIGFLTGEENKAMKLAHEESIITVGEPFAFNGDFDFGNQTMTQRIYKLMPIMFRNRLKAPPSEVYSLHRKLSGFLIFKEID